MHAAQGTSATRSQALSVPAVRRGRNLICSVATMPLEQYAPDFTVTDSALLRQIDPDVANIVTLAQTVEDLLFESISWWLVTSTDFDGFPASARHLDVASVSLQPPGDGKSPAPLPSGLDPRRGIVWVDGQPVGGERIIRFDSPNPAVLKHAGREIRRAIALDKAAVMYADDPRPADYFEPADGADEVDDDEVAEILGRWKAARKRRSTAYIPRALKYHSVDSPAPRDLQLAELQQRVSLDIANALGIDPEDLGVSTTSRTYANDVDRRRNKLNEVLAPYMQAVTGRLSMGDVTRPGYTVAFNTTEYLQPNPTERWATYTSAKALDAITVEEIRRAERKPPLPVGDDETESSPAIATASRQLALVEQLQKIYLAVGPVITRPEAREILNRSGAGLAVNEPAPPPAPTPATGQGDAEDPDDAEESVSANRPASMTFDLSGALTFVDVPVTEFAVDRERRVIEGLIMPYGTVAEKGGYRFQFERGSLQYTEVTRVKLLRDHDMSNPLGKATKLHDKADGMYARFSVARGPEGDRALELAEDGVLDGLSVGVDFDLRADTSPHPRDRTLMRVHRSDLREVSLTPMPTFDTARVTKVAASRTGETMQCQACGQVHAEGASCPTVTPPTPPAGDDQPTGLTLSQDQLTALLARPGAIEALVAQQAPADDPAPPAGALTLSADQVDALIQSGGLAQLLGLPGQAPADDPPADAPTPVNPTRSTALFVREALPYRFDRGGNFVRTEHVFSGDLHHMALAGDIWGTTTDAGKRVMGLLNAVFADTDTADVNELNPDIQRPDMYVDQRDFRYPIWDSINKGSPPNGVQPFVFPKFATASGLVGDHTEGTEPTGGTFTTTNQTVTPTAISGKASITREVWDMGGNPAVSTLIFNQMVRGWREGLESAAATFLNTLTAATDINLGVAVIDDALAAAWDTALAGLQFVRGYDFEMFAIEQVLYGAFVDATDTNGRKLYPITAPQNANGTAATRFRTLDLGGVTGVPAWGLTATPGAANNSWLFDPTCVHGWATPPQRLEFPGSGGAASGVEYKPVAHVDLAIWGYKAFANSDVGGVRQVIYDNA